MHWSEFLSDPALKDLPDKLETNAFGQILMPPHRHRHAIWQGEIEWQLGRVLSTGRTAPEFAIDSQAETKIRMSSGIRLIGSQRHLPIERWRLKSALSCSWGATACARWRCSARATSTLVPAKSGCPARPATLHCFTADGEQRCSELCSSHINILVSLKCSGLGDGQGGRRASIHGDLTAASLSLSAPRPSPGPRQTIHL